MARKRKRGGNPVDWGYPAFARAFPASPELDALVRAFARGDYAFVRREAPSVAAKTEDPQVREAATTLLERTKADPMAKVLFVLTAVLLVLLSTYWILHDGPPAHGSSGMQSGHGRSSVTVVPTPGSLSSET